jgi:vacuolar-type H+-ATPase subunit H
LQESLETIAQKEQEIRGRLLQARASAESILAAAGAEAERIRAAGETAAAAEARAWLDEQVALAQRDGEASLRLATARLDDQRVDGPAMDAAVELILEAVLLGRAPPPGG